MGTAIVLIILLIVVSLVIRSIIKDKKNGKSITCGGDCKNCHGCHSVSYTHLTLPTILRV